MTSDRQFSSASWYEYYLQIRAKDEGGSRDLNRQVDYFLLINFADDL